MIFAPQKDLNYYLFLNTMKRLITLFTAILLGMNLMGQTKSDSDGLIITPDTLHLYFYGCSPHLERLAIINPMEDPVLVFRFYSDTFRVECLLDGYDIAETGLFLPPQDTAYLEIYASPLSAKDFYGKMIIETDIDDYQVVLFYETTMSAEEQATSLMLSPNPANDEVILSGDELGLVSVFNLMGQRVDEIDLSKNETKLSTATYKNGIYFVIPNGGKPQRLVINHKQ